jgi:5-methylthioadenosine/S-adenosylhomocysteine deaminase
MLFKNISFLDENLKVHNNVYIGIKDKFIDCISSTLPSADYGEVYAGKNRIMLPGFINCHTHLPMSGMRGYGENVCLEEWLNKKIFPYEDCLNNENVYAFTMLSIAECLKFGITSVSDMYYCMDSIAKATAESGINANISRAIVSFNDDNLYKTDRFNEALSNYNNYNNYDNGRIKVDFSLHAEYTNTEKVIKQFIEAVSEKKARAHIHLSETKKEVKECMARHNGMSPVEYFNSLGLFDIPTLAAHCVHLSKTDIDILKEKNVSVAHCPVSNLKLASGLLILRQW